MNASTTLRKGERGPRIKDLQAALQAKGYDVSPDGVFGVRTELALIAFQKKSGLLPDGIAGPVTIQCLNKGESGGAVHSALAARFGTGVAAASAVAMAGHAPGGSSKAAGTWSTSAEGLHFLYVHEAQRHVSNHLHFPGGNSGVTLGPGYDMGGRSVEEITRDLTSVGVPADRAALAARAAGLKGSKAKEFAHAHNKLIDLTEGQEQQLLRLVVPKYERHVKAHIQVDIFQYQFDALVSFDYNCGGRLKVFKDINEGKVAAAMEEMRKVNTSGGEVVRGLVIRREHEIALYLYGRYAKSAV